MIFWGTAFTAPIWSLAAAIWFDAAYQSITGTIIHSTLTFVFDEAAAGASVGLPVAAPDLSPYESYDQSWVIPEGTDADALVFSFVLSYGFLTNDHKGAGQAEVSVLGGSGMSMSFGIEDNVVLVQDDRVSLMLRGGDDHVRAAEDADAMLLRLGMGNDTATGSAGDDTVIGGVGDDQISGAEGGDLLAGSHGNDVLIGGAGSDTVNGGAHADVLFGNAGDDVLIGGQGADAFVFVTNPNGAQSGRTVILDFDADEDMLWTGPSNNGTWDATTAYDTFLSGATQRANLVVYTEGDYSVVIWNMVLADLSAENFVDGPSGGYYAWGGLGSQDTIWEPDLLG
ncbi:calcium-binding protein [Sulfitobacter sp. HNIBRBA2951]|uniref:calcium-binding protein n=1 Tax=Sulfitobacter aquimarinus TaxID=3158557 RepID=UPI0032DEDE7B